MRYVVELKKKFKYFIWYHDSFQNLVETFSCNFWEWTNDFCFGFGHEKEILHLFSPPTVFRIVYIFLEMGKINYLRTIYYI